MGLTEQLNDLKQQLSKEIPKEILMETGEFIKGLVQSGIERTACQVGDRIVPFTLPNVTGKMIYSGDILAKGPMVLSFYRGVW
jgi:hypothetical protein